MISASPQELKIQKKMNRNKNNWSNFSVVYLEISHRKESEPHVCHENIGDTNPTGKAQSITLPTEPPPNKSWMTLKIFKGFCLILSKVTDQLVKKHF